MNLGTPETKARQQWPNLRPENLTPRSPLDPDYNCAAFAAGDPDNWWWPGPERYHYWPAGVPKEATLASFEAAYATLGYVRCDAMGLEEGFEKIAIYALNDTPKHVAIQLSNGHWASKLGELKDIEHITLEDLAGPFYGYPAIFMRRPCA